MNKGRSLSILLILIFILISSFVGLGYFIYKDRLNKNNQEIMLNEVKNSVMDRNYKKAYSITKMLKENYPQNADIAMLESTLSELANNSPFESKDLQRDIANQILDKIKGREKSIPINNENSEIAFNNRYIKNTTTIENYADRQNDSGIEDADILEFKQSKVPENLGYNKNKIDNKQESNLNNNESINNQKNLFNLRKLKDNLTKELNSSGNSHVDNQKKVIMEHKKNEDKLTEKNTNNSKTKEIKQIERPKEQPTTLKLKPSVQIKQTTPKNIPSKPQDQITGKIERPYSYSIKKELYEILDNINTGNPSIGKARLNEMIKKGLSDKFNKVNALIDSLKNQEAARLLLKLIKQNVESKLVSIQKAPLKKELFKQDQPKQEISQVKDHSLDSKIQTKDVSQPAVNHFRQTSTDLKSLKMLALANEEKQDLQKAEEIYEEIASMTKTAEDYYRVGIIKFKLKKHEESIKAFNETTLLNPKHKKAYTNKGTALIILNKPKEAVEAFQKAIAIDQNYDTAYYKKGIAEEKNNDDQNAFLSFKKAHDITKNPLYALKTGISANHIGDFQNGEKYLNMASSLIKEKIDIIFYNLSISKFENDDLTEALKIIDKALSINPEKSEYLYLKASICLTKGNYNDAILLYNTVILKNPENITAHINLAKAYEKLGNELKAIETLEKISNTDHVLVLNNLGILYKTQKNYQKAINIFQKAEKNLSLEAKYNLATTFFAIKDNKRAMEKFKEYIKLDPNNPEALHALGIIEYNENGNDKVLKELIKKFPNYDKNKTIIKIIGS
ncbi:cell surface protein [Candidatus Borreliella tachyglossi]|uniref:Cell surface protein n=1 Tax=Candidatus Borreliella tachyglossi TaxID=1964448 RepID=A0A2S1LWE0_9SPIR|nr:tetratricopeptide repeat protein [Candidatus Borreliella tachyglossi]AWG42602.1 cell surface protein [Candidatus Borreliella tachyglossi]